MTNIDRSKYWRKAGIYRIYSLIDDRCYIGSSKNLYRRVNTHYNALLKGKHSNSKLQRFANKYTTDNLEVEVLLTCKTHELCAKEDEQRTKYDSFNSGFDLLENSYRPTGRKYGSKHRRKLSKIQKGNLPKNLPVLLKNLEKAREACKAKHEAGLTTPTFTGKKHKESSKQLMAIAKTGKPSLKKVSVVCLDINGNVVKIYNSALEASKATNTISSNIIACCKGKRKTTGGFKWQYKE